LTLSQNISLIDLLREDPARSPSKIFGVWQNKGGRMPAAKKKKSAAKTAKKTVKKVVKKVKKTVKKAVKKATKKKAKKK
jgi:hypothetical protein